MSIFLTGATGFVGSSILRTLRAQGREVTALVRNDAKAAEVSALGASAVIGELSDSELITTQALASDGVIHVASPGDASSASLDDAFVTAVFAGLEGSDKPFVHTGGIWVFGDGAAITEESPQNPPAITAWRAEIEKRVLSAQGVKTTVIMPGIVYGYGSGIPNSVVDAPRVAGVGGEALKLIGSGDEHWTTVYVDDLAALYVLAFDLAPAGSVYLGVNGQNPTTRELGSAASYAAGLDGRVAPSTAEEVHAVLGVAFGDALLLDQQATGEAARAALGWSPTGPSLVDELRTGSYAPGH
ncbi:NAD-dependent epimerase/dehydratase family protein [Subtercola endophyticus]|uniref:NAD-dependent epimerase/dehydratase family protein n=1 Tax=Subtercola endophyticus TaxID=2895559 RepID=UPI001E620C70|nr:NAD-dependent epimerase/dehydratase family protein [Subtercola endophyticus]UFS60753.1 NAD-dependent epimerase/dehydratase family protein [Subtercola endophyticus]